jgi:hypothetical protein
MMRSRSFELKIVVSSNFSSLEEVIKEKNGFDKQYSLYPKIIVVVGVRAASLT